MILSYSACSNYCIVMNFYQSEMLNVGILLVMEYLYIVVLLLKSSTEVNSAHNS